MTAKTRNISTLIESQLPGFIVEDYENVSKFIESYYEQLELRGQPLDILHNITQYRDINFYDKSIIKQSSFLSEYLFSSETSIKVDDARSFPKSNGYIKIGNEICFYKERTDTEFLEVSRGVSGNTTLGDLYNSSEFVSTEAENHAAGSEVFNVSNLFLYAFAKNIEREYLQQFPENAIKDNVDKRLLIKNITDFYKAKGSERSIRFIFNTLISNDPKEEVSVYNPKDFVYKSSVSDWITKFSLKVVITSGDPKKLIGNEIRQEENPYNKNTKFASAVVDNIVSVGKLGDQSVYELILAPETIIGEFTVNSLTTLKKNLNQSAGNNNKINVWSTSGFPKSGKLIIDGEIITYKDKNVTQFIIESRQNSQSHSEGEKVYGFSTVKNVENNVNIVILGVMYNLLPSQPQPYASSGDRVQVSKGGFETIDPIVFDRQKKAIRWILNKTYDYCDYDNLTQPLNEVIADVSAIYEDDLYFYIASSSFPSYKELLSSEITQTLQDQKHLKLIRKNPIVTTEIYPTTNRDTAILVDGSVVYSYKDFDSITYGNIESFKLKTPGTGYKAAPFVLINEVPGKARCSLAGETISSVELLENEIYTEDPYVRITSGENAKLVPIITDGAITSIKIENPGRYYSSPPIIRIVDFLGKGSFAEYEAILNNDGQIIRCKKLNGGKFYTRDFTKIFVDPVGSGATAEAKIKRWVKDRYYKNILNVDKNNGYVFENYNPANRYGYGVISNPLLLRKKLNDNLTNNFKEKTSLEHSPIIGFAYDGNPIYGPYGFSDPLNSQSNVIRLKSSYVLKNNRKNGPSVVEYPLGTFIDDYAWSPTIKSGKEELDQNNGRFCVTPDYPKGTYAYFISIDSNNNPVFPYIIGNNYYSLPVDSNYNSNLSQDDLPQNSRRLDSEDTNGSGVVAIIKDVTTGGVNSASVVESQPIFSVGSELIINNSGTAGNGAKAYVSSVQGKSVVSLESNDTKAVKISLKQTSYLFKDDIVSQYNSDGDLVASGTLIDNVFNDKDLVLRDVSGTFNSNDTLSSTISVFKLLLDTNATYSKGATLILTDGKGKPSSTIAQGEILQSTVDQNSVIIKLLSGNFVIDNNRFLKSSILSDTSKSNIISVTSLSSDLNVFDLNDNIAIVETEENHNLSVGDIVNIDINPDLEETESLYYVRKRLYQNTVLLPLIHRSNIKDTGIGRGDILNTGNLYESGTYENVELIFRDSSTARKNIGRIGDIGNARATIVVGDPNGTGYGPISSFTITKKGSGYRREDILTIPNNAIDYQSSLSTQFFLFVVGHSGFSNQNEELFLTNVTNLSQEDYIKINNEVLKITFVDKIKKSVKVLRAQKGSVASDHFDGGEVEFEEFEYRFNTGYRPFGEGSNKPYVSLYEKETNKIFISYAYGATPSSVNRIQQSSSFFDESIPQKLVKVKTTSNPSYKLEFSKTNSDDDIVANPSLALQKYYRYKFDTSHYSMLGTFLDISSSINYNVIATEKFVSDAAPGNPGSYVSVLFGFAPFIVGYPTERQEINYSSYFYFIKATADVSTDDSVLKIINDPLTGQKEVIYTSNTKFVYELNEFPAYDGTGSIFYTTTSKTADGHINSVSIQKGGESYRRVPIVDGVIPDSRYESKVSTIYDPIERKIVGINIDSPGKNYSKPIAVIVDGDGKNAILKVYKNSNGGIDNVLVLDGGSDYSYRPTVKIVESDVKIYFNSDNIGNPKNVSFISNGSSFNNDKTTLSDYVSETVLVLSDFDKDDFFAGFIIQPSTGARAQVSKNGWRIGSNLLKIKNIQGIFKNGESIRKLDGLETATIVNQIKTKFNPDIKSYLDNVGYTTSDRGKLSTNSQKITDSFFYQDYSYVVQSKTPIEIWRDLIKFTTHAAGFELFGELDIESDGKSEMPAIDKDSKPIERYSCINLQAKNIDTLDTKRYVTNSYINFNDLNVTNGIGCISVDDFDTSETRVTEVVLNDLFDGVEDANTGKRIGTTTFTIYDKETGLPLSGYKEQQLIVTLDGILQEPQVAYTISGNNIIFSEAPFGERLVEGQLVPAQKFYCRLLSFRDQELNDRYFNKLKDISDQFDGFKTEFKLYYADDSVVKTDENENLLVLIDSVLQDSKAYQIKRYKTNTVPDRIKFSSPPVKQSKVYISGEDERSVNVQQKSFIFGIGNYIRVAIDDRLLEKSPTGPFLLLDQNNNVVTIDDPLYALVFVDGVLQIPDKSYVIAGSVIYFNTPLKSFYDTDKNLVKQDVKILYFYGRNIEKTLTIYDFDPNLYFGRVNLLANGTANYDDLYQWYYKQGYWTYDGDEFVDKKLHLYHIDDNSKETYLGEVLDFRRENQALNSFAANLKVNHYFNFTSGRLKFVRYKNSFILDGSYEIEINYNLDSDGKVILNRSTTEWLYNTPKDDETYFARTKLIANLHPNDKIKIDGEQSFRTVLNVPNKANTKQYNLNQPLSKDIYTKIRATNYNGPVAGKGLGIIAEIDVNGSVKNLQWNKRDLLQYINNNLLLPVTAYGYTTIPEIVFIPRTKAGGGAKARVVSDGNNLVDIVLENGGYGYEKPPKVVIARRYQIAKERSRKIDTVSLITLRPIIDSTRLLVASFQDILPLVVPAVYTSSAILDIKKASRDITSFIFPKTNVSFVVEEFKSSFSIFGFGAATPSNVSIGDIDKQIVETILSTQSVKSEEIITKIDFSYQNVITNAYLNAIEATRDIGAILQVDLLEDDIFVYIADTRRFPDSGKLLIGKEIVTYNKKLNDRFYELIRGDYGTQITDHFAGDYLRYLPESITVVPVGPSINITSESVVRMTTDASREIKKQINVSDQVVVSDYSTDVTRIINPVFSVDLIGGTTEILGVDITLDETIINLIESQGSVDISITKEIQQYYNIFDQVVVSDYSTDVTRIINPVFSVDLIGGTTEILSVDIIVDKTVINLIESQGSVDISITKEIQQYYNIFDQVFVSDYSTIVTRIINPVFSVDLIGGTTEILSVDIIVDKTVINLIESQGSVSMSNNVYFEVFFSFFKLDTEIVESKLVSISSDINEIINSIASVSNQSVYSLIYERIKPININTDVVDLLNIGYSYIKYRIIEPLLSVSLSYVDTEILGVDIEVDRTFINLIEIEDSVLINSSSIELRSEINTLDEVSVSDYSTDVTRIISPVFSVDITGATAEILSVDVEVDRTVVNLIEIEDSVSMSGLVEFNYTKTLPISSYKFIDNFIIQYSYIKYRIIEPLLSVSLSTIDTEIIGVDIIVDKTIVNLIQIEELVSINSTSRELISQINTLDEVSVSDYSTDVTRIISPVFSVDITGATTEILSVDIQVDRTVVNLIESQGSVLMSNFVDSKIFRTAKYFSIGSDLINTADIRLNNLTSIQDIDVNVSDFTIRATNIFHRPPNSETGEFYSVATFPGVDGNSVFEYTIYHPVSTAYDTITFTLNSFFLPYSYTEVTEHIDILVNPEVQITQEVTRYYPNRHLNDNGSFNELIAVVTFGPTVDSEVFKSSTIPGSNVFGTPYYEIVEVKLVTMSYETTDVVSQIQKVINPDIEITQEVTRYYPNRHLNDDGSFNELIAVVTIQDVQTNLNDYEKNVYIEVPPFQTIWQFTSSVNLEQVSTSIERIISSTVYPSITGGTTESFNSIFSKSDTILNVENKLEVVNYITPEYSDCNLVDSSSQVNTEIVSGVIDYVGNSSLEKYALGNLGTTYGMFERNSFISNGSLNVNASIATIIGTIPIEEFELRRNSGLSRDGIPFQLGIPTINELGTTLVSITDTTITVDATLDNINSMWPSSGYLLIGKELVKYNGVSGNTFIDITRGWDGTEITLHSTGDYIRTIG